MAVLGSPPVDCHCDPDRASQACNTEKRKVLANGTGQLSGSQVRHFSDSDLAITALGRKVLIVLHWDDRTTSTIYNIST